MKSRLILSIAIAIAACSPDGRPPPHEYKHWKDQLLAATGGLSGLIFDEVPCSKTRIMKGLKVSESIPLDDCYYFSAPKKMSGIWLHEFEGSKFIPGAKWAPRVWKWTPNDIDLRSELGAGTDLRTIHDRYDRRAYRVKFVGRSMLHPARNRWDGRDRIVLLDRLLESEEVPAPTDSLLCTPDCHPFPK